MVWHSGSAVLASFGEVGVSSIPCWVRYCYLVSALFNVWAKKSVSPLNIAFSILYIFPWKITSDSRGMASNMIDSCLAERCFRLLVNRRKNSLFLGCHRMIRVCITYFSIVSTCKLQGYSKNFFTEIVVENRDYEMLMLLNHQYEC